MYRYTAPLLLALAGCATTPEPADRLLVDGAVYTVDDSRPWAEAIAIRDGHIVGVGTARQIRARFAGPVTDLAGKMVLPGFADLHAHPIDGGIQMQQCDLSGLATVDALLDAIRRCDAALAHGEWLVGAGWNLALFAEANPSKELLDQVSSTRPIYLRGEDGHSSWANSLALKRAGIDAATPDPPQGIIERDAAGAPSGTVRETAQNLLETVVPQLTRAELLAAARSAVALANRYGITSIIDAAARERDVSLYDELDRHGELTVRVQAAAPLINGIGEPASRDRVRNADRRVDKRLRLDLAKIFVDGVLEGETAALLEPYIGARTHDGMLVAPEDELTALVTDLDASGTQIHFHTIGDRGARVALDALAAARERNGQSSNRHHISHLQLVDADDHARFADLDVAANFQALWAYPEPYITEVNLPVVGAERVERMYPIGSLERAGARIVAGSDWPVSTLNPLPIIETAVTRRDASGIIDGALNAQEAVSLETMLAAYTREAAWVQHRENELGTIEVGKRADLVVLERNLFEIPAHEIGDVLVTRTYLDGELVFSTEQH